MQTIEMALGDHDGSDAVLAQSVAAESDWLIEVVRFFDADGVEIGGLLAQSGVKMRSTGWVVRAAAHASIPSGTRAAYVRSSFAQKRLTAEQVGALEAIAGWSRMMPRARVVTGSESSDG